MKTNPVSKKLIGLVKKTNRVSKKTNRFSKKLIGLVKKTNRVSKN